MPEPENIIPELADELAKSDDVEVVAHSDDDEEVNAGCVINGKSSLD